MSEIHALRVRDADALPLSLGERVRVRVPSVLCPREKAHGGEGGPTEKGGVDIFPLALLGYC